MRTVLKPLTEKSTDVNHKLAFCLTGDGIVTLSGKSRIRTVYGVNVTDLSITKHIPDSDAIDCDDVFILAYLSYLYTLRLVNTRDMRRLTKVPREVVTQTKDSIFRSYDLVRYKIATLRCVYQGLTPKNVVEVEKQFTACGLRRIDAVLYYLMYDNNDIQKFVNSLQAVEDTKFVLHVNTLRLELDIDGKINKEFEKTAAYFTYQQLMFIVHGNRFSFEDIRNDLKTHAISSYYRVRPFYGKLHAINYAKNSIRAYSQCLIDYYNKDDRRRMISTPDGYDNTVCELTPDVYCGEDIHEIQNKMAEYIDAKAVYR